MDHGTENPAQRLIKQYAETPVTHGLMDLAQAEKKAVENYRHLLLPAPEGIVFRYPHQESGGQLQRAMVAMACKPDIIVFDDPTTALDNLVGEEILTLLQNLQNDLGVSYLFITHDVATVKVIADEEIVMLKGKIVEKGSAKGILTRPDHDYTKRLLDSVPEMDPDRLDTLQGERKDSMSKKAV